MLRVTKVEYLCEYKLKISFNNGKIKIVDFEAWILEGGVYLKLLKDVEFFKKVRLDDSKYSISWPNGADFCPDVLYEVGQEVSTKTKIIRAKKIQNPVKKRGLKTRTARSKR